MIFLRLAIQFVDVVEEFYMDIEHEYSYDLQYNLLMLLKNFIWT